MELDGYHSFEFPSKGKQRKVFRRGAGPGVMVMHELPGLTPACLALAERIVANGYTVYVPLLFGEPGKSALITNYAKLCVSREFKLLAANGVSPITVWLRDLCRHIYAECGGPGIGVIGMCLTGGFVLSMMLEPSVIASVTSQPSLPLGAWTDARKSALGVPTEELQAAAHRADIGNHLLGLRFGEDRFCPRQRFDTLHAHFGDRFIRVEIPSQAGNSFGISSNAHAVLTEHFVDNEGHPTRDALRTVLAFLDERLHP